MSSPIWPKSSPVRVSRSLSAHTAIGLALSALIYILVVTGTLSVFNREFQRWEQPAAPEMSAIAPEAAARAATAVFESEETPSTHLYINFPRPDLPRTVITTDTQAVFATATGEIAGPEHFPWTQFLLDLHYYLHLPHTLGIIFVGALGAFLLALSLSGFMAHPRIFRDAFTFRRGEGRLPLADLHNRLSVWTAPFHIINTLTGAVLGLSTILAFAIAAASFDGDTGKVFSPIFGEEPAENEAPAPMAEIAGPLAWMAETHPDLQPTYFILHDPGTAGQHVNMIAAHADRLIFGEYYNFDAAGNYLGNTGLSDGTAGQQIAGSIYNLHFGSWGGLPVKLAYGLFGLSLSFIVATGLNIYFHRCREHGRPAPKLAAAWAGTVWGVPAALSFSLLLSVCGIAGGAGLVLAFWLGLIAIAATCATSANAALCGRSLRIGTALLLCLSVVVHSARNVEAIGQASLMPVSLGLLLCAGVLAWSARDLRPARRRQLTSPAE